MPPILRSSGPSTPVSAKKSSTTTAPRSITRKTPQCAKCGRQRAGHPRSGCPFADDDGEDLDYRTQEPELADALGSLSLISISDNKAALRARRRTGDSRFTSAEPEQYTQQQFPAMRVDRYPPGTRGHQLMVQVTDWQEGVQPETRTPPDLLSRIGPPVTQMAEPETTTHTRVMARTRPVMPGTLNTPEPSFFGSPVTSPPPPPRHTQACQPTQTYPPRAVSQARSMARSSSIEERENFLGGLYDNALTPPANVFAIPMDEIYQVQHSAVRVGFYSRVLPAIQEGTDGWLILGSDDNAVHNLFEGLNAGRGAPRVRELPREDKRGGNLSAVAGGAFIGAVATFTGLALT